jgi:hypothetical protein
MWFILTRHILVAVAVKYKAKAVIQKHGEGEKYWLKVKEDEETQ